MDENNKKNDTGGSSLLGDILRDTYKQIIVPKSKEIVNNMLVDGIYMISDYLSNVIGKKIFGPGTFIPSNKKGGGNPSRTNYSGAYKQNGYQQQNQPPQQNVGMRSSTELQYVVAESREQAEEWKNDMVAAIRRFGHVPVSSLYEKTGGKIKPLFNDFDYGWNREEDIHYVRNADGYWFNLPKPTRIK